MNYKSVFGNAVMTRINMMYELCFFLHYHNERFSLYYDLTLQYLIAAPKKEFYLIRLKNSTSNAT